MEVLKLWFEKGRVRIKDENGKEYGMPLSWFPQLATANAEQRKNYELHPDGC